MTVGEKVYQKVCPLTNFRNIRESILVCVSESVSKIILERDIKG